MEKIKKFTDLRAWQEGHRLVLLVYQATKIFPTEERYGLTSQMRRCAVSITSNITEGFGRLSLKEKKRFYDIALGSVLELQNQLFIARDIGYISKDHCTSLISQSQLIHKITNGLMRFVSD